MSAHAFPSAERTSLGDLFRMGMRRLASGVSIVTTRDDEGALGFSATSISSVAIEPVPCLLMCVNRSGASHDALLRAGFFSVNILAEADQDIARRFSSPGLRHERFAGEGWTKGISGAPIYRGALASFDCELATSMVVQTHTVMIGKVLAARYSEEAASPLVYFDGGFAALQAA